VYTLGELIGPPSGRTVPGIILGILGTLAMLGAAIYSWRRRYIAAAMKVIDVPPDKRRDLLTREKKALDQLQNLQRTLMRNPKADLGPIAKEIKKILKEHKVGRTIGAHIDAAKGQAPRVVIERREWGGRLRTWYLWHLSLGTLSVLFILLHAGFRFGNVIATLAFLCLLGVVITGFIGIYFYWTVPPRLTIIEERAERTPEELRDELQHVTGEMHALIANKSQKFLEVYNQELSIPGVTMKPNLRWLFERATIERDTARPDRLRLIVKEIPPSEQEDFRKVIRLIFRKEKIEVSLYPQLRYDYLLKAWLTAHIPLSAGMWAFSVVHVISVLYY
ncbi:MAG: hypothetical protein ACREQQ_04940, partial [Candidatus Binatia bacterium]